MRVDTSAVPSGRTRIRVPRYRKRESVKDFLCVAPALAFFAVFVYYPLADLFRIGFTNWNLIRDSYKFVGLKNYKWLFHGSGLGTWLSSLRITFSYTFWEIAITLIGGMLLAALFNRESKAFAAMRSLVFMPKYIAVSTSAIVFMWILNDQYGFMNYLLGLFGVAPVSWLNSEKTAFTSLLILTGWRVVGYGMMIYLSAMKGISKDYYEAAQLDGANGFQRFRFVTLPLLSPTTLFLFVTTFIASMKVFQSVDVMTDGGPYESTNVMVYWIYDLAFVQFRVDRAAVVAGVFFVILLAFTAATMKISNKNVHYDS
ncbi:MAG: sugar ABC transporter permease [Spirochaetae bacterium HGW-Spirochaetae-3]|jgi:multiple sugar transport system permease protein/sn-glycerol 3-phosphate transport system permease protein|nr:MAG: sugar ABC transporter permease [Spirochaetae bacterium HGW-Spirochaetae-3]